MPVLRSGCLIATIWLTAIDNRNPAGIPRRALQNWPPTPWTASSRHRDCECAAGDRGHERHSLLGQALIQGYRQVPIAAPLRSCVQEDHVRDGNAERAGWTFGNRSVFDHGQDITSRWRGIACTLVGNRPIPRSIRCNRPRGGIFWPFGAHAY